nr:MAG TPA: hypothetical protein [Caudoviricetes sp.]
MYFRFFQTYTTIVEREENYFFSLIRYINNKQIRRPYYGKYD